MAGIYIHIPFCRQKCHYCNFFSIAGTRGKEGFLEALLREAELRREYLAGEIVSTIYFGGGTPSLLTSVEIAVILDRVRSLFAVTEDAEITLEANPDDVSPEKAREWAGLGINRISVGIQSFFDDDLHYLNRVHNGQQALESIRALKEAGFANLTADLIYGIPTLTDEKWKQNLEVFFSQDIPHLSAYALTVEQKTALDVLIRKGKYQPVDEIHSVGHFRILLEEAKAHDFIHYEISNFAREGHYSRHNSLYWLGGRYLGLGPSAHSFDGHSRQWNVSNLGKYNELKDYQSFIKGKEVLTPVQRYNEYVMTSLRTIWGCDTVHIENVFGLEWKNEFLRGVEKFIGRNHLRREGTRFFLTDEGKLFADGISSDLFLDEVNPV